MPAWLAPGQSGKARHGLEDQAQVVPVLEGAQQTDAVPLALRVRARQFAKNDRLQLACAQKQQALVRQGSPDVRRCLCVSESRIAV